VSFRRPGDDKGSVESQLGPVRCAVVAGAGARVIGVGRRRNRARGKGGARQRSDVAWSDWGRRARTDASLAKGQDCRKVTA
jgi:hypothetical protein